MDKMIGGFYGHEHVHPVTKLDTSGVTMTTTANNTDWVVMTKEFVERIHNEPRYKKSRTTIRSFKLIIK